MDEVIVELTSSFIMADLGIAHRARAEHAAYIASWIEILKDDPRAIFTAASARRPQLIGCTPSSLNRLHGRRDPVRTRQAAQRCPIVTRHPASQRLRRSPSQKAKARVLR